MAKPRCAACSTGWPGGELTVFRPSVVFGPEDRFMNLFASLARFLPVLPIAGSQARLQPIYVGDVALAMAHALDDPRTFGQVYPLAGPQVYTLGELVQRAAAWSGHPRPILPLPMALGKLQAGHAWKCCRASRRCRATTSTRSSATTSWKDRSRPNSTCVRPSLEAIAPEYLSGQHPRTRFDSVRARHGRH